MTDVEKVAQILQDHMEQHYGVCLKASEWDDVAQAALSAIDPVALVQAGIDAAAETAGIHPVVREAIRALSASDVLKEMK